MAHLVKEERSSVRIVSAVMAFFLVAGLSGSRPATARDLDVSISEVHYHPVAGEEGEFVELFNAGYESADLSGWTLEGGVGFAFRQGTVIAPRGYLVVAADAARLLALHGLDRSSVTGDFTGRLANSGEVLVLRNGEGEVADRVRYADDDPWPRDPDGRGPSLERIDLLADGEGPWAWRASRVLGGTPGRRNSLWIERSRRLLIAPGARWRYRQGLEEPAAVPGGWADPAFDDTLWSEARSPFGYGAAGQATILSDMRGTYTTLYLRRAFVLPPPERIESLVLTVTYDDAYVAYLGGVEVGRSRSAGGIPGVPLPFDAAAASPHEVEEGVDIIELTGTGLLAEGENVLAVQGLNGAADSARFTLLASLTLVEAAAEGDLEPAPDLEINEVFAGATLAEAFLEIYNEGDAAADLSDLRLVADPLGRFGHDFPRGARLGAGEFIVVTGPDLPLAPGSGEQWFGLSTAGGLFVDGARSRARPAGRPWGRFPDGDGSTFVLSAPTPGAPNAFSPESRVAISEIRYHPPPGAEGEEFIEIHNRSSGTVALSGWRLAGAVEFEFPSGQVLPPGGYLVVSGDPGAIEARYGVSGVLGPWSGRLSNAEEEIELLDGLGNRADAVHYADDGTWPPTGATGGPDGLGASIELLHPWMENDHGSAWAASSGAGTPGAPNSRREANPAPVIRSPRHRPSQPRPGEPVAVTARVAGEEGVASVHLAYRAGASGAFTQVPMLDDGAHGDGPAGDGRYGALLPPQAAGAIVEFYLSAADPGGAARRLPPDAPGRVLLYQVDERVYPASLPLYRAVLREADFTQLVTRSLSSDELLDGTFIRGDDVFYNVGIRYRGEHTRTLPVKPFRVQFSHDRRFDGARRLNLQADGNHLGHLAADFLRRAEVPVFQTRPVAFALNGNFGNAHGGIYLQVEAVDRDFLRRRFPGNDGGNLYRGRAGGAGQADLSYLGSRPSDYEPLYEKETNELEDDTSDIIELTRVLETTPEWRFFDAVSALVDVEEWVRFFAAQVVLSNQDGAIATTAGEDYFLYHRPSDGRWVIIPWDQSETFREPGGGLFRPSSAAVQRLLRHPRIVPSYLRALVHLLDGPFAVPAMAPRIAALEGLFPEADLAAVSDFVAAQGMALRGLLPRELTAGIEPRYLVRSGERWRFHRGTREPAGGSAAWTEIYFDDAFWEEGPGGFGYGSGRERTVLSDMLGRYTSLYLRRAFQVADPARTEDLVLSIRYDDAFVLYLNGTEVARRNISGPPRYDRVAAMGRESDTPEILDLSSFRTLLVAGTNVVAAVGFNASVNSLDFSVDAELYEPPPGAGCGSRLVGPSGTVPLGGTAPVLETSAVVVSGERASYDAETGRWHHELSLGAGGRVVPVQALDAAGGEVASAVVDLAAAAGLRRVAGAVSGGVWRAAQGPYLLAGEVLVPAGASLRIDPGVLVYLEPGSELRVEGTLEAQGREEEPILFLAASCGDPPGGLVFTGPGAQGTLRSARLEGAAGIPGAPSAVRATGGARLWIEGCRFGPLPGGAIEAEDRGTELRVTETGIERCAWGLRVREAFASLAGVRLRELSGGEEGILLAGASQPRSVVRDSVVEESAGAGIRLEGSSALLEGNVLRHLEVGVAAGGGAPSFLRLLIHDCGEALLVTREAVVELEHLTVTGNRTGLYLHGGRGGEAGGRAAGESSIIWGNGVALISDELSELELSFSDVEGGYPGPGNGDFDPLFVDPRAGDFRLRAGSPAIGAGRDGEDMGAFSAAGAAALFVRGDANGDGLLELSDAVRLLGYLFRGAPGPRCVDALDVDDTGRLEITDGIAILAYLFRGGAPPAPPYPEPGEDPTADGLPECR